MSKKVDYNKKTSEELGWKPEWFGASAFDEKLVKKITQFQSKLGVTADGMCGPGTFRLIYTERMSEMAFDKTIHDNSDRNLIFKGEEVDIEWDKVIRWVDEDGLKLTREPTLDFDRDIKTFVTHWDVCLSSRSCVKVLNQRNIHIHFCIDNDGTIYQLADMAAICFHAGGRDWNRSSIGVEMSNAFYPKYQKHYVKNGFGERPIKKDSMVHGRKVEEHLDFYPVQIEALKALYKAVHKATGIPMEAPMENGEYPFGVYAPAANNQFRGFISHHHLTTRKMDCCNINIADIMSELS